MDQPPDPIETSASFVSLLTEHQPDLWAFVISLMPGHPDVADVIQKTNVVLWKKQDQFRPGSDFRAWAFQVARFETLHHLRSHRRDGWVPFDEQLADTIAEEIPRVLEARHSRLEALEHCLARLRPQDRALLEHRYRSDAGLDEYARDSGRSVSALSVTLFRLRAALRKCISSHMAAKGGLS